MFFHCFPLFPYFYIFVHEITIFPVVFSVAILLTGSGRRGGIFALSVGTRHWREKREALLLHVRLYAWGRGLHKGGDGPYMYPFVILTSWQLLYRFFQSGAKIHETSTSWNTLKLQKPHGDRDERRRGMRLMIPGLYPCLSIVSSFLIDTNPNLFQVTFHLRWLIPEMEFLLFSFDIWYGMIWGTDQLTTHYHKFENLFNMLIISIY